MNAPLPAGVSRLDELSSIRERQSADPRAQRRRQLYRADPMWRLTKLKANRETRMRAKRRCA